MVHQDDNMNLKKSYSKPVDKWYTVYILPFLKTKGTIKKDTIKEHAHLIWQFT